MKQVPVSAVKGELSRYLREAGRGHIVITRRGKPAGVLIGFETDEDFQEFCLAQEPRFLARIAAARKNIAAGRGVKLEDLTA